MSAKELGTKLVAFCREGKNMESINTLYDSNVESTEAVAVPGMEQTFGASRAYARRTSGGPRTTRFTPTKWRARSPMARIASPSTSSTT